MWVTSKLLMGVKLWQTLSPWTQCLAESYSPFCSDQDIRTWFVRHWGLLSLWQSAGLSGALRTPGGLCTVSSVAEIGVWPQGHQSDTDQLYCMILQKSLTSLSLSFPFCLQVYRRQLVPFVFHISAVKLTSLPCSLSSGHTGLCTISRPFQTHTHLKTFTLAFLLPENASPG